MSRWKADEMDPSSGLWKTWRWKIRPLCLRGKLGGFTGLQEQQKELTCRRRVWLWVQEGGRWAYFYPWLPAFTNRFSSLSAHWVSLHLLKMGQVQLYLCHSGTWNLVTCVKGIHVTGFCQSGLFQLETRVWWEREVPWLPSVGNGISGERKALKTSVRRNVPHGSFPSETLLAKPPDGLLANLSSIKVYHMPVSFLLALMEK